MTMAQYEPKKLYTPDPTCSGPHWEHGAAGPEDGCACERCDIPEPVDVWFDEESGLWLFEDED